MISLEQICLRIQTGDPITQTERHLLDQELHLITCNTAQFIYCDLCAIVNSIEIQEESTFRILNLEYTPANYANFYHQIMEIGTFVDRVADSITLTTEERHEKWENENSMYEQKCKLHQTQSTFFSTWSQYQLESRTTNEKAYKKILPQILPTTNIEWQLVIVLPLSALQGKPRALWSGIQISKLSQIEQQALVHKLDTCRSFAPDIIDDLRMYLRCAIFYQLYPDKKKQDPRLPHNTLRVRKSKIPCIQRVTTAFGRICLRFKKKKQRKKTILACLDDFPADLTNI